MTSVKTIMSKNLKTISTGTTLQDAYALMEEFRVRHLPVINESQEIIGIVSYKNLLTDPTVLLMPVEFFMSFPVVEVPENTTLKSAILKILEKKISSLLITNNEQEVVGIVTTDDLLWHLASHISADEEVSDSFISTKNLQTVGEIARLLSQAGI